ncbi:DeoR/GlpR family DNA-binding transcription regulator [Kitasatospora misakiensis]|uniref:DeoR/GlpR family DNA-binding transcription regulator n=1 Tax=Kitasatospora misakiensis TaxID=67330 RepID=A0ABW0X5J9_9ACTN
MVTRVTVGSVFAAERRQLILEMVRANGAVSLRELARVVQTSEVTVRRDVRALEAEGLLDRRHGGAVLPGGSSREPGYSYSQKTLLAPVEKNAIADLAAGLVQAGDTIMVGAGTTTLEFARRLARIPEVTVVTNSLPIALALAHANRVEVVMTGGTLSSGGALVGSDAEDMLREMRTGKAFLSGGGLTAERGLSTATMLCASVDRVMVQSAAEVIVLADHTKLGAQSMFPTVPTEAITRLVTDQHATADERTAFELQALADCGVQIDLAPLGPAAGSHIHDQVAPVTQPRLVPLPAQRRSAHLPARRR